MEALRDELVRTHTADGSASVRVVSATGLVREAARRHATPPTATVALGRALMGTLLLATGGQDGERVQLHLRGDGPLGAILVTAESDGAVRGYVQHPGANPPLRGEDLGVCDAVGFGTLSVERNHASWKRPYTGIIPIVEGEIAQDLARYLLESEQKPSTVALGIYLSRDGEVEAAGGYLIQSLPGAEDEALAALEAHVAENLHPSALVRGGLSADDILDRLLDGIGGGDRDGIDARFECPCSLERVRRAATLLGRAELRQIAARGEPLEMRCHFCNEEWRLSPDEVGSLLPDA
ncbi:MAG: Hsp33 family molecular chaperone HslO [Myxococcota bacterium]